MAVCEAGCIFFPYSVTCDRILFGDDGGGSVYGEGREYRERKRKGRFVVVKGEWPGRRRNQETEDSIYCLETMGMGVGGLCMEREEDRAGGEGRGRP